jgi:hypothetical protein
VTLGAFAVTGSSNVDAPQSSDAISATQIVEPPAKNSSLSSAVCRSAVALNSKLVVTTTILGRTRRAAIVNGRLYREGDRIGAGNELYRLAGIAEDHIDLVALAPIAGAKRSVTLNQAQAKNRDPSESR